MLLVGSSPAHHVEFRSGLGGDESSEGSDVGPEVVSFMEIE